MQFSQSRAWLRLALTAILFGFPAALLAQDKPTASWSYYGDTDAEHWGKLDPAFASCSLGKWQSPIDITGAKKADLPPLKISYNATPLNIIDNGHLVQINYAPGSTLTVGDKVYTLRQFHFHHPGEERINGEKFDLVAHFVHTDDQRHIAVIAVLYKTGASQPILDTLWKNIPTEKNKAVIVGGQMVNAKDLLPSDLGYYTFTGSLTAPPCSEGVTWYVLKAHDTLSAEQLATFAKVYPLNARPIQPTNGREILETK